MQCKHLSTLLQNKGQHCTSSQFAKHLCQVGIAEIARAHTHTHTHTYTHIHTHTHTRTSYQLRSSPVAPLSQHITTERLANCLLPSSGQFTWRQNFTWRWKQVVSGKLCGAVCCDNGRNPNRYSDNTHKKSLSRIYIIPANWRLQLHCKSTLHHSLTLWRLTTTIAAVPHR